MSKAKPNAITPTNRRRFLRLAASTAAATAFLAAPALAKGRDDARLFATIARIRPLLSAHAAAEERARATHALVDADPDKPAGSPIDFAAAERDGGSTLSERTLLRLWHKRKDAIYRRHGYDTASDEWNRLGHELRVLHLPRLLSMRPRTAEGTHEKWKLVFKAFQETEQWDVEDFDEFMVPALVADLERLAGKAVRA